MNKLIYVELYSLKFVFVLMDGMVIDVNFIFLVFLRIFFIVYLILLI